MVCIAAEVAIANCRVLHGTSQQNLLVAKAAVTQSICRMIGDNMFSMLLSWSVQNSGFEFSDGTPHQACWWQWLQRHDLCAARVRCVCSQLQLDIAAEVASAGCSHSTPVKASPWQ